MDDKVNISKTLLTAIIDAVIAIDQRIKALDLEISEVIYNANDYMEDCKND